MNSLLLFTGNNPKLFILWCLCLSVLYSGDTHRDLTPNARAETQQFIRAMIYHLVVVVSCATDKGQ